MSSCVVSIILPTRQRPHLLPRALQSICQQTFPEWELIVVDDNAPGSRISDSPLPSLVTSDPRIRILENPTPRNAATAREFARLQAQGKWIAYCDDDDAWRPDKLTRQVQLAENSGAHFVMCGLCYRLQNRQRHLQCISELQGPQDLLINAHATTNAFLHRNLPELTWPTQYDAAEDRYFYLQALHKLNIQNIPNVAAPLVDIYPQPGPRTNTRPEASWAALRDSYLRYVKGHYPPELEKHYLLRLLVQRAKLRQSLPRSFYSHALALIKCGGLSELRPLANVIGGRLPGLRHRLVS